MEDEMQISDQPIVEEMALTVEDEAMDEVLGQGEGEVANQEGRDHVEYIETCPLNFQGIIDEKEKGHEEDRVPFVMRELLKEISLEHARRIDEEPMWGVDNFQICLVVHIPHLGQEGLIRINHALDVLLDGAHHHGVGHDEREGEMRFHLFADVLGAVVQDESRPTWVMLREGGRIQDIIIKQDQNSIAFRSIVLHLLDTFEFQVLLHFNLLQQLSALEQKQYPYTYSALILYRNDIIKIMANARHSTNVICSVLAAIDDALWKEVAARAVSKMTPANVTLMNQFTFQSLAEQSTTHLQLSDPLHERDQHPHKISENIIESSIPIDRNQTNKGEMPNFSMVKSTSRNSQKKSFFVMKNSRNSRNSSKADQAFPRTKTNKSISLNAKLVPIPPKEGETAETKIDQKENADIDISINGLRDRIIYLEEKKAEEEVDQKNCIAEMLQREEKLRKKLKQITRLSYDYSGDFINYKSTTHNKTLCGAVEVKTSISLEKNFRQRKKQTSERIKTLIENERIKEREEKIMNSRLLTQSREQFFKESSATRFANGFEDTDTISEGVKIESKGSNFSKEKLLNRAGLKMTLQEYRNDTKNKKFREFRFKNKIKASTIKAMDRYGHESELPKLANEGGRIETGRRIKTTIESKKSSENLSQSLLSQHVGKQIGKIKVSSSSLFDSIFSQNGEEGDDL